MKVILCSAEQLLRQSYSGRGPSFGKEQICSGQEIPTSSSFCLGETPAQFTLHQPKEPLSWAPAAKGNPVLSWAGDTDLSCLVGISATKEHDGLQIGFLSLNSLSRSFVKSFKGKLEGLAQKALSVELVPVHKCPWGKWIHLWLLVSLLCTWITPKITEHITPV